MKTYGIQTAIIDFVLVTLDLWIRVASVGRKVRSAPLRALEEPYQLGGDTHRASAILTVIMQSWRLHPTSVPRLLAGPCPRCGLQSSIAPQRGLSCRGRPTRGDARMRRRNAAFNPCSAQRRAPRSRQRLRSASARPCSAADGCIAGGRLRRSAHNHVACPCAATGTALML